MKKLISLIIALGLSMAMVSVANARNTQHMLPIDNAMSTKDAQAQLDGSVKFFFGDQRHPRVIKNLGTDVANRKTNAFGKSDETACNWVFLSAMKSLDTRAHELGANAVINIVSYYKKNEMSSMKNFECHAGAVTAAVALKGDFVKIAGK